MALPKNLKLSESEISQEIDLKKLTGVDVSNDPELLRAIEQDVIDYIKQRSEDHKGIGGKPWKNKYSQDYVDSQSFEAAGKSQGDVNLRLSGDMLESIDVVDENGSKFKIAIDNADQLPKAYGHMTGFEGHPTIKNGPKRQFFGVTDDEMRSILKKYKDDLDSIKESDQKKADNLGLLIKTVKDLLS